MSEPKHEQARETVVPKTDREAIAQLLSADAFKEQQHERGQRLEFTKREALIAVQNTDGGPLQFIIMVQRTISSGVLWVEVAPTYGEIQKHPDLTDFKLQFAGKVDKDESMTTAIQELVQQLHAHGYLVDTHIKQVLEAKAQRSSQ